MTRKVKGGAYGSPNLATMKPVLQMRTNTAGMARIRAGIEAGVAGDEFKRDLCKWWGHGEVNFIQAIR